MMIELKDLSYGYARKTVLEGLNVRFEEGGMYAVMGANGCGKTTLLRLVAGLLVPDRGEVLVGGCRVDSYSARELAQRMAFVRQYPQTDFEFSAFETVLMGRNPYQRRLQNESQEDWDIVERCMKQTNTWHLRFAKPGEMSGGELRRVMLARALAQQTPIMLLDEPLANLDLAHQYEILELLRNINRNDGIAVAAWAAGTLFRLYCSGVDTGEYPVCFRHRVPSGECGWDDLCFELVNSLIDERIHTFLR